MQRRRTWKLSIAAAAALVGTLGLGVPVASAGTSTKYYSAAAAPTTIQAGVATPVTVTLTNSAASTQTFGSAELTVGGLSESQVTVGSLPQGWTASFASSDPAAVLLTSQKHASIAPGGALAVPLTLTATDQTASPFTIATAVKQSNDFLGTGNDFTNTGADPTITVQTVSYTLAFSQQPQSQLQQSVPPGNFTSFCPPVSVQIENSAGSPVAASGVEVDLSSGTTDPGLYFQGSPATTVSETTDASGVATFGDCSSGLQATILGSGYSLTAGSPDAVAPVTSDAFAVVQSATSCAAGTSCQTATVQSSTTKVTGQATIGGPNGSFQLSASFGLVGSSELASCESQVSAGPYDPLEVTASTPGGGQGTVTMVFPKSVVDSLTNNGTPLMPVCAGASEQFAGSTQPTTGGPWVGLVEDCVNGTYPGTAPLGLCVLSRAKSHGGIETIQLLASDLGDPKFW